MTVTDARVMTEAQLQACVLDAAARFGWLAMHIHDSRQSTGAGYPDITLCHQGTGKIVFAELKTDKGRVMPRQHVWLNALNRNDHVSVAIWRPIDWYSGTILAVLRG